MNATSTRALSPTEAAHDDHRHVRIPLAAHKLTGFRDWARTLPENVKVALVGGEVFIDMSNEDIERHVSVKGVIFATLYSIMANEDLGQIYQDGGLLTNDAAGLASNPDALAARWETLECGRLKIVEEKDRYPELQGTPDWVLEVVSPGSATKDLRNGDHAAGIPEYWIVDARRTLSFTILHWRKGGYATAADADGWQWSKIFGRYFRLRLEHRRGIRKYTLDSAMK